MNEKGVMSPILVAGARIVNPAEHVLMLIMNEFYGPERIRFCQSDEALAHYLNEEPGFIVYVYGGENGEKIQNLFYQLMFTSPGLTKILACNEVDETLADRDLGADHILGFSDKYQGDDFSERLRKMIGPSATELGSTAPNVNFEIPDGRFILPMRNQRGAIGGAKYLEAKSCLNSSKKNEIITHFKGGIQMPSLKLASFQPHLDECQQCCADIMRALILLQKSEDVTTVYEQDLRRFDNAIPAHTRMMQEFFPDYRDDDITE